MAKRIQCTRQKMAAGRTATTAERIFHNAIEAIQAQVKDTGSLRGGRSVLLETLYPESPIPICADLSALTFTQELSEWLSMVQIGRTSSMLKERLTVPLGMADPGITIFGAFHENDGYMRGLLEHIASDIAGRFENDGLNTFVDLIANRLYMIGRDGLTKADISEADAKEMYARQVDWHQKLSSRVPLSRPADPEHHLLFQHKESSRIKRTAVVLGCLPMVDEYDIAVAACGQRILQGPTQSITHDHGGSGEEAQCAMCQAVLNVLSNSQYSLSPEEYWRHYKEFLAISQTLPKMVDTPPVLPGQYRELLASRQALRNSRLRLLASYTGLYRSNATEKDFLAAPYPLFFRLAEELIRQTGGGVACLVSPTGFLAGQPTEKMRKQLLSHFSSISVIEMKRINSEKPAFEGLPQGVALNVAVSTMGRAESRNAVGGGKPGAEVWYLAIPNGDEPNLSPLLNAPAVSDSHAPFKAVLPSAKDGYSFRPPAMAAEYLSWPSIVGIYSVKINGAMGKRGSLLLDTDRERLAKRMQAYLDANLSWEEYVKLGFGDEKEQKRFNLRKIREEAWRKEGYSEGKIQPYLLKPFDIRWCYYTPTRPLWNEPRPELAALQSGGNHFLAVRSNPVVDDEGIPFFFTNLLGDSDLLRGHAYYIPTWHKGWNGKRSTSLSKPIQEYLGTLGVPLDSTGEDAALLVHYHTLAIGFAPAYLHENRVELGQGWPRIPFPGYDLAKSQTLFEAREAFRNSADLGRLVAQSLEGSSDGHDPIARTATNDLHHFAVLTDESDTHQEDRGRLFVVNQGWGKGFRDGAVLPSHGKLSVRAYFGSERRTVEAVARSMRVHAGAAYSLLGDSTRDIYLNERVCLRNVPVKVWDFTVGGHQVLKKWLSYREEKILDRALTFDEVDGFCAVVRRIVALRLMGFHLNRNYSIIRDLHRAECVSSRKY